MGQTKAYLRILWILTCLVYDITGEGRWSRQITSQGFSAAAINDWIPLAQPCPTCHPQSNSRENNARVLNYQPTPIPNTQTYQNVQQPQQQFDYIGEPFSNSQFVLQPQQINLLQQQQEQQKQQQQQQQPPQQFSSPTQQQYQVPLAQMGPIQFQLLQAAQQQTQTGQPVTQQEHVPLPSPALIHQQPQQIPLPPKTSAQDIQHHQQSLHQQQQQFQHMQLHPPQQQFLRQELQNHINQQIQLQQQQQQQRQQQPLQQNSQHHQNSQQFHQQTQPQQVQYVVQPENQTPVPYKIKYQQVVDHHPAQNVNRAPQPEMLMNPHQLHQYMQQQQIPQQFRHMTAQQFVEAHKQPNQIQFANQQHANTYYLRNQIPTTITKSQPSYQFAEQKPQEPIVRPTSPKTETYTQTVAPVPLKEEPSQPPKEESEEIQLLYVPLNTLLNKEKNNNLIENNQISTLVNSVNPSQINDFYNAAPETEIVQESPKIRPEQQTEQYTIEKEKEYVYEVPSRLPIQENEYYQTQSGKSIESNLFNKQPSRDNELYVTQADKAVESDSFVQSGRGNDYYITQTGKGVEQPVTNEDFYLTSTVKQLTDGEYYETPTGKNIQPETSSIRPVQKQNYYIPQQVRNINSETTSRKPIQNNDYYVTPNVKNYESETKTRKPTYKDDYQTYKPVRTKTTNTPRRRPSQNNDYNRQTARTTETYQPSTRRPLVRGTTTPRTYITQTPFTTTSTTTPVPETEYLYLTTQKPKPHQPPLAIFMQNDNYKQENTVSNVLNLLQDSLTINVVDSQSKNNPKIFIGPSELTIPDGYTKFKLPYLSNINSNRNKHEAHLEDNSFFVAPQSYKPASGYKKISLPAPHVGSLIVKISSVVEDPETYYSNKYTFENTPTSTVKTFSNDEYYSIPTSTASQRNPQKNYSSRENFNQKSTVSSEQPFFNNEYESYDGFVGITTPTSVAQSYEGDYLNNQQYNDQPKSDYIYEQPKKPSGKRRPSHKTKNYETNYESSTYTSKPPIRHADDDYEPVITKVPKIEQSPIYEKVRASTKAPNDHFDEYRMKNYFKEQQEHKNRPFVYPSHVENFKEPQNAYSSSELSTTTTTTNAPKYEKSTELSYELTEKPYYSFSNPNYEQIPGQYSDSYDQSTHFLSTNEQYKYSNMPDYNENENSYNQKKTKSTSTITTTSTTTQSPSKYEYSLQESSTRNTYNDEKRDDNFHLPSELPPITANLPGMINSLSDHESESVEPKTTTIRNNNVRTRTRRPLATRKPYSTSTTTTVSYDSYDTTTRRSSIRTRRPQTSRTSTYNSTRSTVRNPNRIRYNPTNEERQQIRSRPRSSTQRKTTTEDNIEYQRDVLNQNYPVIKSQESSTSPETTISPEPPVTINNEYISTERLESLHNEQINLKDENIYNIAPVSTSTEAHFYQEEVPSSSTPVNYVEQIQPLNFFQEIQQHMQIPENQNRHAESYSMPYNENYELYDQNTEVYKAPIMNPVYIPTTTPEIIETTTEKLTSSSTESLRIRRPNLRKRPVYNEYATEPTSDTTTNYNSHERFTIRSRKRLENSVARQPTHRSRTKKPVTTTSQPIENNEYSRTFEREPEENLETNYNDYNQNKTATRSRSRFVLEAQESHWSPPLSYNSFQPVDPLVENREEKSLEIKNSDEPEILTVGPTNEDSYLITISPDSNYTMVELTSNQNVSNINTTEFLQSSSTLTTSSSTTTETSTTTTSEPLPSITTTIASSTTTTTQAPMSFADMLEDFMSEYSNDVVKNDLKPRIEFAESNKNEVIDKFNSNEKKRGFWRRVRVRPLDGLEVAESQHVGTNFYNTVPQYDSKIDNSYKYHKFESTNNDTNLYLTSSVDESHTDLPDLMTGDEIEIRKTPETISFAVEETTTEVFLTTVERDNEITTTQINDHVEPTDPPFLYQDTETLFENRQDSEQDNEIFQPNNKTDNADSLKTPSLFEEVKKKLSDMFTKREMTVNDDDYDYESMPIMNFKPKYQSIERNHNRDENLNAITEIDTTTPIVTEILTESNQELSTTMPQTNYDPLGILVYATSTSREVSHETEICYRGRCVKTDDKKKN